jgi:hypothetical protein
VKKILYLLLLLAPGLASAQTYVEPGPAVQLLGGRGGTLTGPLILFEDPLQPKEAVTLEYLNSIVAGITAGTATQANWTATSGGGVVLNKPTFAAVATSGSYVDLINKPTIPAATVIDSQTGAFLFVGAGVSHTGTTYTFSGGGGSSTTLQTNGSSNASTTALNFVNSTTNSMGLVVTAFNSGSSEKFEVTGSSETVTFSSTPTFSASTVTSYLALTGNVTSFTLASGVAGQSKTLAFCQDATGGHTVTAPSNVRGFMIVSTTASKCSVGTYTYFAPLSAWLASSAPVVNQ